MKKSLLAMTALAAMLFAGCTSSDEITTLETIKQAENAPTPVSFGTYMGRTGTRTGVLGGITTTDILKGTASTIGAGASTANVGFGVFGYYTGTTQWTDAQTGTTPNFMYNQQVKWNSSTNAWEYNPIKYWPNGKDAANADNAPSNTATETGAQYLSFFAYAPYVDKSSALSGVGITKINNSEKAIGSEEASTGNKLAAAPYLSYTLDNTNVHTNANVDLLWGLRGDAVYSETDNDDNKAAAGNTYNTNLTKETVAENVNFLFKHALAKVGGYDGLKIVADVDGNGAGSIGFGSLDTKSCITVRSIIIQNTATATNYAGDFNLATGTWLNLSGGTPAKGGLLSETIATNPGMNDNIYDADGTVVYDAGTGTWTPSGVTTTAKRVYANSGQDGFYMIPGASMQLEVKIDYDVNTYDTNINGNYVKTNQVITNNVTLPATLQSNKYYTLVIHLGLTSVKFSAEVAGWDSEDAGTEKEIWLPSNVVKYTTATTVAAGANATVNTTAATTSYTINLTGVQPSTDLSVVTPSGSATAAVQSGSTTVGGSAVVNVTLAANASTTATQTGTVTITGVNSSGEEFTTIVTIVQEKAYTMSTTLASGSSTAEYAAAATGSYTINVTGMTNNGAYTVTSTDDTNASVAASGTADGSGDATVAVSLTANGTGATRTFTITIRDNTTGTPTTVVINQIP